MKHRHRGQGGVCWPKSPGGTAADLYLRLENAIRNTSDDTYRKVVRRIMDRLWTGRLTEAERQKLQARGAERTPTTDTGVAIADSGLVDVLETRLRDVQAEALQIAEAIERARTADITRLATPLSGTTSASDRVADLFRRHPGVSFSPLEVSRCVAAKYGNVRQIVLRLNARGVIPSAAWGRWMLSRKEP